MNGQQGIEQDPPTRGERASWSRRRFLGRVATVAWMTPLIMSVGADEGSAQASCAGPGESCAALECCAGCDCVAGVCLGVC